MERAKQLPYTEPPFCTYQYFGSPGVVAMQNPTAYNHYLNHSINLDCGRRFLSGYTSPDMSVCCCALQDMLFIEHIDVRRSFIDGCELDVIRNMIDDGYYVCFNMVDVYYIEGMLWFEEFHNLHDGMVCGYDDNDHTLTIAAYDSRWFYRSFKTPQEGFVKALASGKERGGYDGFIGLKPKNDTIPLDLGEIARHLEEYLTPDLYGTSFEGPDPVHGIIVHDYMRLYLQFLLDGEIPYDRKDRRIMRLVLEHKKCMADRIAAVENKLGCSSDLSNRYAPVAESANRAHTYYVAYRMKQKDELLRLIQKELATMKAIEEDVLPDFLKLIKEVPHAVELPET
jgi:hypothetical protein